MNPTTNFAGISDKYAGYETSKIIILPVPYKEENNPIKGTSNGTNALLTATHHMQLYDIETNTEVYKEGIHIAKPLSGFTSASEMVDEVYGQVKNYIKRNKFVSLVGGEASVSIGAIKAANECFDDLTVLHIGANANLRNEYEGSKYHSKCAMYQANQQMNLVQVGIRSMHKTEKTVMNPDQLFFAYEMAAEDYWMDTVTDLLSENVHITFDLNGMDPSLISGVCNPEPGGLFWYETLEFLQKVFKEKKVVGLNMTGLCPNDHDKTSAVLAARLLYKMLTYKFQL